MKPYFETENGKLYHDDCREIMPQLGPVDLVLTDPPYGVQLGKKANNQRFDRKQYSDFQDTDKNPNDLTGS